MDDMEELRLLDDAPGDSFSLGSWGNLLGDSFPLGSLGDMEELRPNALGIGFLGGV